MNKRSEELNDEERVSIVMDLMFAGYETTAGLLSLLLYYLAQAPEALEQLMQEHQTLTKSKKPGDPISWRDIQQLNFNSHVCAVPSLMRNLVVFVCVCVCLSQWTKILIKALNVEQNSLSNRFHLKHYPTPQLWLSYSQSWLEQRNMCFIDSTKKQTEFI